MIKFGSEWLRDTDEIYKSDRHFYMIFNSWFNDNQKEAMLYIRTNFNSMGLLDAKKLIKYTIVEYEENNIKNRLKYILEQHPELII